MIDVVLGGASHALDLRLRIQDAVDKINVDRHQLRCQCEIKAKVKDNVIDDIRYNEYLLGQRLVLNNRSKIETRGPSCSA